MNNTYFACNKWLKVWGYTTKMYSYNPDIHKFVVFVVVNNCFITIKRLFQDFLNTEARSKCRNSYKIQNQDMVTCICICLHYAVGNFLLVSYSQWWNLYITLVMVSSEMTMFPSQEQIDPWLVWWALKNNVFYIPEPSRPLSEHIWDNCDQHVIKNHPPSREYIWKNEVSSICTWRFNVKEGYSTVLNRMENLDLLIP